MAKQSEDMRVESNVALVIRSNGRVRAKRVGHNICTLPGRGWLRDRLCPRSYPPIPTAEQVGAENPFAQYPGGPGWPIEAAWSPHVMRYCAFGSGGLRNGGTYQEHQGIPGLESPLPIALAPTITGASETYEYRWLCQAEALPSAQQFSFPSATEVCFRFVIGENDLRFSDEPVVISEILALTSIAHPYKSPTTDSYGGGSVPGAVAYHIMTPVTLNPGEMGELLWYWRY